MRRFLRQIALSAVVLVSMARIGPARADIVSTSPIPFPTGSSNSSGNTVGTVGGFAVHNGSVDGIVETSDTFSGAGEDVTATGTFHGMLYTIGGTFIGNLVLPGTFAVTLPDRTFRLDFGTFAAAMHNVNLAGIFNGQSVDITRIHRTRQKASSASIQWAATAITATSTTSPPPSCSIR